MKFSCDQCSAQYMIADEKVGTRGVKVKCKKCGHVIVVKPVAAAPAADATVVDSDTGAGGFGSSPFNEPTQAMSASQLATLKAAAGAPAADAGFSAGDAVQPTIPGFMPTGFDNPFAAAPAPESAPAPANDNATGPASFGGFGSPAAPNLGDMAMPQVEGRSSTEFNIDRALGTGPSTALAPAPSQRPAGEKEWYVAVDDAQIGPVDLREMEQRWDGKEITEDSLAWKAGMADWSPIAEIPELAYLITERPQQKPQMSGYVAGNAAATGSTSLPQPLAPMAFGTGAQEGSDVSWKPSAASALSSLVQDELVATAKPAEEARPSAAPADMGMPSFGATDLFSKGGNGSVGTLATPAPSFGAPVADPFTGGQSWSVPKPTQSSGFKPLYLVLGLMGLIVVALVVVVVLVVLRPQQAPVVAQQQPTAAVAQPPVAAATQPAVAPTPAGTQPTPTPAATPAETAAAAANDDNGTKHAAAKGTKATPKKDDTPKPTPKPKKDDLDELVTDKPKPKPAGVSTELTKDQVMDGVRSNASKLGPCLQAARSKNELTPGKHTLVLDFVITPSGSVTGGALKGPAYVMGSSMPACFAAAMKNWSFPASKSGAPVRNFPLPFTAK